MDQEFLSFISNVLLFLVIYKIGQYSMVVKTVREIHRSHIEKPLKQGKISIEEIDGIFYAYDGNDFLAQGKTPEELGALISKRFPNKYRMAGVEFKV